MLDTKQTRAKALLTTAALCIGTALGQVNVGFNVSTAASVMMSFSQHSWEWGTAAQALLELDNNELSVFGDNPFPNGKIPNADPNILSLSWVKPHINRNSQVLADNSAAGDPASMGVSALLLGKSDAVYSGAADRQANYLLTKVPRYANGAISHRSDIKELWADNMAMSFPFRTLSDVNWPKE